MGNSRILSIQTANPAMCLTQPEVLKDVLAYQTMSPEAQDKCQRFFLDHGVETRHLGMEKVADVFAENYDQTIERFTREASAVGHKAARLALDQASVRPEQIDALIVTTCTGYLCPGLATYISQLLGLRADTYLIDMVGQGCAAAIPALRAADYYLQSHPNSHVMCVSVEICSAAFCSGEETDLLISNAIFGDGAAACVLGNSDGRPGLEFKRYVTLLAPEYRDELRFKTKGSRLCNVLSRNVPILVARAVKKLMGDVIPQAEKVDHYAFHTGGRAILDRIADVMALSADAMFPSREVLRRFGNMSSPSVLFVLKEILERTPMKAGQNVVLFSYGAGFTAHGLWAQWVD